MNQRIREIRKALNMTLEEFGKNLGVTKTAISTIENGKRNVTDQMFLSICRTYNVNPAYLKDGTGDMFVKLSREEEIAAFIGQILKSEDASFPKRFISVLSRLSVDEWKLLEKIVVEMAKEKD